MTETMTETMPEAIPEATTPPGNRNPFSHVDQRVGDLEAGVAFYGVLLPAVGFSKYLGGNAFRCWTTPEGSGPAQPWLGITEDRAHRAGASRIAFWVVSRESVDRVAGIVLEAGARDISGPKVMPEYSETYYAVFFEDPWGNLLEVVHWLG